MKRTHLLAAAALAVSAGAANAQSYSVPWYTIDGGGGTSTGGGYTVSGTIGQHDAAQGLTGGNYTVNSGFWAGVSVVNPCQADMNGDGFLDIGDITAFVAFFLDGNLIADFNGDGFLDIGDISAYVAKFLEGC